MNDGTISAMTLEFDADIKRLSGLSKVDYDQERKGIAKALNLRVTTLDQQVGDERRKNSYRTQGRPIEYDEIERHPEPVHGAQLLDSICAVILQHMAISESSARIVTLWALHCYCYDLFTHSPRLLIAAPEKECGKTVLLGHILRALVPKPQSVDNLTPAVFFRLASSHCPTFLIDEVDSWIRSDSELPGAINGGFERHGGVMRCEGDGNEVRHFSTFTPVAMAGINLQTKLPSPTISRSLTIDMQRALPGEIPDPYDQRKHEVELQKFRPQILRWVEDHRKELEQIDPELPSGVINRDADKWRPLAALAGVAGEEWPTYVKTAVLMDSDAEGGSLQEQLLKDIHTVIAPLEKSEITGIWTETLLAELCGIEGSIWKDLNFKDYPDQSLKARQLSSKLRPYKVKPKTINLAGVHKKGYRLDELRRVINRYSQLSAPAVCVTPLPLSVCGVTEEFPDVDSESDVTDKTTLNVNVGNGSNEVTDNEAGILLNDCVWPEVDSDFESEVKTVAEKRLAIMAVQYNCTLDELLEWFSDPDDMKSIAIFTRKQLEGSVQFYLDQIDVCN